MKNIIESELLESGKSDLLICLIQRENTQDLFVSIKKTQIETNGSHTITISSDILPKFIELLVQYNDAIKGGIRAKSPVKKHLPKKNSNEKEIVNRYLNKGINITDLALQFDLSEDNIKQVLISQGLPIVNNRIPHSKKHRGTRKGLSKNSNRPSVNTIDPVVTDMVLFELLTELRRQESKKNRLPPFVLFLNISLMDMATIYPTNLQELEKCRGINKGKVRRYGKPFIELIEKYLEENNIRK